MAIVPNRFITRFDGLRHTAPSLVQVIESPRIITLRTWAESPLVSRRHPTSMSISMGKIART